MSPNTWNLSPPPKHPLDRGDRRIWHRAQQKDASSTSPLAKGDRGVVKDADLKSKCQYSRGPPNPDDQIPNRNTKHPMHNALLSVCGPESRRQDFTRALRMISREADPRFGVQDSKKFLRAKSSIPRSRHSVDRLTSLSAIAFPVFIIPHPDHSSPSFLPLIKTACR